MDGAARKDVFTGVVFSITGKNSSAGHQHAGKKVLWFHDIRGKPDRVDRCRDGTRKDIFTSGVFPFASENSSVPKLNLPVSAG